MLLTVMLSAIPVFSPAEPFILNGVPLDTGMGSAPLICDWNGDGLKDVLIGTRAPVSPFQPVDGAVLYLPNTGTLNSPFFDSWTMLEADGQVISFNS
jgi:hypothetical protein